MFRIVFVLALIQFQQTIGYAVNNEPSKDREMLLAFVVNRHGERSPDSDELSLSNEQEKIRKLIYIEGLEGLTNTGKQRAYQLGKFIRSRYGAEGSKLLSNVYFKDEIMLRSTDKERTKMTALVAMSAVYPPVPEQQWDTELGKVWQPVPYTAVPLKEDYLRYYQNCPQFKELMKNAKLDAARKEFRSYNDLNAVILKQTGKNFNEDPSFYQTLFDLLKSQTALGLELPQWAKPHLQKIGEAAKLAYRLYFRTDEMKKLGGGVILNDFLETAQDIMKGKPVTNRFRMYSAHDFNIGSLMEVTKVVRDEQSIPHYGAVFGLELYRSKSTGEFTVLPMYLPQAGNSTVQYLHFSGCEKSSFCEFRKFMENSREFALPEREFYNICEIRTEL